MQKSRCLRSWSPIVFGCVIAVGSGRFGPALPGVAKAAKQHSTSGAVVMVRAQTDATRVKGAESCQKCHQAEYMAWTKSKHFRNHERVTSAAGREYAQKYGGTDTCMTCHSTPHTSTAKFAGAVGVSCESCHSPAGGSDGWFDVHFDYGGADIRREDETVAHLEERLAACEAAGMNRAMDAYALAMNCCSCHIVASEKLLKTGHKPGHSDFDLIPWMQGELRHNFQVDQQTNADSPSLLEARYGVDAAQRKRVLLVVGKIAELETCLRNLASIDAGNLKKRYAGRRGWAGRAEDAYEYLAEEIGQAVDNEHINAAVAAVKDIRLGRKFTNQTAAFTAANKLGIAARLFVAEQAEANLAGLDRLIKDLGRPKGTAYSP